MGMGELVMRRHRIAVAIGLTILAGATTAEQALAQNAKRGQQAQIQRPSGPFDIFSRNSRQMQRTTAQSRPSAPPVQYRTVVIGGRFVREPVRTDSSLLPRSRTPQRLERPDPRRAVAHPRQVPAQPRNSRHVNPNPRQVNTASRAQPVRTLQTRSAQQAVRTQPSRTEHRAAVATPVTPLPPTFAGVRPAALVAEARRYLGTNPTGRARLWCARFVNFVLKRVGQPGTGSDAAKSFAFYGRRISGPQYGAIAVLTRKGGGHVGIVTGVDRNGNPILIAGNNGRRKVGISVYPKRRVIAYVMPDGRSPNTGNTRTVRSKASRYASVRPTRTR